MTAILEKFRNINAMVDRVAPMAKVMGATFGSVDKDEAARIWQHVTVHDASNDQWINIHYYSQAGSPALVLARAEHYKNQADSKLGILTALHIEWFDNN